MKFTAYYSYLITTALLVLAGLLGSASFAYASVLSLLLTIGKDCFATHMESKVFKSTLPDEAKKAIQDLNARITSIEAGIARRGF